MKKVKIRIIGVNDIINFVEEAQKVESDVNMYKGRYVVDAKSILGVFSINTDTGVEIEYDENEKDFEKYLQRFCYT